MTTMTRRPERVEMEESPRAREVTAAAGYERIEWRGLSRTEARTPLFQASPSPLRAPYYNGARTPQAAIPRYRPVRATGGDLSSPVP